MIESAACREIATGKIHTGRRHHEIMHKRDEDCELIIKDARLTALEQGFVDHRGNFKTREEAAIIAYCNGQIDEPKRILFSEDLY